MVEIDEWIREFKDRVDPNAVFVKSIAGEDSDVVRVFHNPETNKYYYLSYIREWFYSFSKIYNLIGEGPGESIHAPELFDALEHGGSWIVVCKPVDKSETRVRFYGCPANDWHDYALKNNSHGIPKGRRTENWSVPAKLLVNMDRLR
jgi:hypothetical protein